MIKIQHNTSNLFITIFIKNISCAPIYLSSCFHESNSQIIEHTHNNKNCPENLDTFFIKLVDAAMERTSHNIVYDPGYYSMKYPNGDIDSNIGVCADVIIRVYRQAVNIDLQQEIHKDMMANFEEYPKKWGLKKPDTNIDHRRVPNLMKFFERKGSSLPITNIGNDYRPGDIVAWNLSNNLTHIGIVVCQKSTDNTRHLIVHNIGTGPKMEDVLFNFIIIGHYRYKK